MLAPSKTPWSCVTVSRASSSIPDLRGATMAARRDSRRQTSPLPTTCSLLTCCCSGEPSRRLGRPGCGAGLRRISLARALYGRRQEHLNSATCGTRHVPTRSDGVPDLGGLFLREVGRTLPLRHLLGLPLDTSASAWA